EAGGVPRLRTTLSQVVEIDDDDYVDVDDGASVIAAAEIVAAALGQGETSLRAARSPGSTPTRAPSSRTTRRSQVARCFAFWLAGPSCGRYGTRADPTAHGTRTCGRSSNGSNRVPGRPRRPHPRSARRSRLGRNRSVSERSRLCSHFSARAA